MPSFLIPLATTVHLCFTCSKINHNNNSVSLDVAGLRIVLGILMINLVPRILNGSSPFMYIIKVVVLN